MNRTSNENELKQKKEYLMSYRAQVSSTRRAKERLTEAKSMIDLSMFASYIKTLEKAYRKEEYRRIILLREIADKIEAMDINLEKDILLFRYIKAMDWEEIAEQMQYTYSYVLEVHRNAIKNFKIFKVPSKS